MNSILTPTFYKGMIYVLSIAVFMLIFEMIFFNVVILPENEKYINKSLKKFSASVNKYATTAKIISEIIPGNSYEKEIDDTLATKKALSDTIDARETKLIKKLNNDLIIYMSIIIIFFAVMIVVCYYKITDVPKDIMPIVCITILTIIILVVFQAMMYVYGHKFLYTTDMELKDNIMNYISISTYAKP